MRRLTHFGEQMNQNQQTKRLIIVLSIMGNESNQHKMYLLLNEESTESANGCSNAINLFLNIFFTNCDHQQKRKQQPNA